MLSNRVFYVFYISDKYYDIFKDKKRVKIDFRDKGIIDAEIYNITKKDDIKEIVVMLSSYYYIDGIENIRFIDGELIINNTKGIKVDRKSLFEVDDNMETAGIYLAKANYTKHVKVNIVAYDKNFAIIDSFDEKNKIELYDTYIINPKNIKDGQQITN
jgi:putative ubiquitin-RnfH superfamily antitoxin RatB of RatAB toxin-antitoxin module